MKNKLEIQINIWENHVRHHSFRSLNKIFNGIKNGAYKNEISEIRQLFKIGNSEEATNLKKKLTAFASAGIFDETKNRKGENIKEFTGILTLDVDDLLPNQVEEIRERANSIGYTVMSFLSPSGLGMKILVAVNCKIENYKEAYSQVSKYYQDELGVPLDKQTSDVARLCYMSYDTNAYLNKDFETFEISILKEEEKINLVENDITEKIERAIKFTEKKCVFEEGQRNKFIHLLACNCSRYGFAKSEVLKYLVSKYQQKGFENSEINSCVNSAYENNKKDYKTWDIDRFKKSNIKELKEDEINIDSPYIEDFVKNSMPNFLKSIIDRLKTEREKDVFITGIITVLSGCINTNGVYREQICFSDIYSFISAPPASGKGILNYCKQILLPLHIKLKEKSEQEQLQYGYDLKEYKENKSNNVKNIEMPIKPKFKTLFVPANSSATQFAEHLRDNGGCGIVVETEADTLVKTLNSDFGNYSDILRNAFHHEMVSIRRKTNKEYIEIYKPRLAVALSGTPNQLKKLIESVENGLFSRFIYYVFQTIPTWSSVAPQENTNETMSELIDKASIVLMEKITNYLNNEIRFEFTLEQWKKLDEIFELKTAELSCFIGEDASPNVFRLGLVTFRIAMVLSVLNSIDKNEVSTKIICSDEIFTMANSLSETYYQHLTFAFKLVKNNDEVLNINLKRFLEILPIEFDRKTAIDIAHSNKISSHERTLDKYLKRLVDYKYLVKNDYNNYQKIKSEQTVKKVA